MLVGNEIPAFERDIATCLRRVRNTRARILIPKEEALYQKRPRALFHPTVEMLVQTGGRSEIVCPGDRFHLDPWDCCIMPRGVPHAETAVDTDSPYNLLVFIFNKEGPYLHRGRQCNGRIEGYGTYHLKNTTAKDAFRLLEDATLHHRLPEETRTAYARALIDAFLLAIQAALRRITEPPAPHPTSAMVRAAEQIVRTRLGDPSLQVTQIAASLGCSSDHLSRLFRKEHKLNLRTWIQRERIALACELLKERHCNVAEVGWACGFNEPSYFIRVFRHLRGTTPLAYRSQFN